MATHICKYCGEELKQTQSEERCSFNPNQEALDGPEGFSTKCPSCGRFTKYVLCDKDEGRVVRTFFRGIHCEVCGTAVKHFTCTCSMRYRLR